MSVIWKIIRTVTNLGGDVWRKLMPLVMWGQWLGPMGYPVNHRELRVPHSLLHTRVQTWIPLDLCMGNHPKIILEVGEAPKGAIEEAVVLRTMSLSILLIGLRLSTVRMNIMEGMTSTLCNILNKDPHVAIIILGATMEIFHQGALIHMKGIMVVVSIGGL